MSLKRTPVILTVCLLLGVPDTRGFRTTVFFLLLARFCTVVVVKSTCVKYKIQEVTLNNITISASCWPWFFHISFVIYSTYVFVLQYMTCTSRPDWFHLQSFTEALSACLARQDVPEDSRQGFDPNADVELKCEGRGVNPHVMFVAPHVCSLNEIIVKEQ